MRYFQNFSHVNPTATHAGPEPHLVTARLPAARRLPSEVSGLGSLSITPVPEGQSQPHSPALPPEGAAATPHGLSISSSFLSWHSWVPSADPPKSSLLACSQKPLLQLSLPQCPSGRHPRAPLRAQWIASLIKMRMPDIGRPIQGTVSADRALGLRVHHFIHPPILQTEPD